MSTRSMVGILNNDGTVTAVYCHNDGYPEYNGLFLKTYYNTEEKARELINLGDLSSIKKFIAPPEGVVHTFDHSYPNVTIAYARDRGEDFYQSHYNTEEDYFNDACDRGDIEFIYLFKNNDWIFNTLNNKRWKKLDKYVENAINWITN